MLEDLEVSVGSDHRHKPYSTASLDNDWYGVFSRLRRVGIGDDEMDGDAAAGFAPSVGDSSSRGLTARPAGGEDDVDGRGSFDAKELERELKLMRRAELEEKLGTDCIISFTFLDAFVQRL